MEVFQIIGSIKSNNMEFIRTLRERHQTQRQANMEEEAESVIRLADFADSLYIAYDGVPLIPIDKNWTTKEIIQQLSVLRNNYVTCKMQQRSVRLAAML